MINLIDQAEDSSSFSNPLDEQQPFVREMMYSSGGQPNFVLFLDQTVTDLIKYCTTEGKVSPLVADTTFNIGEYYFTQTTYKNLSVVKKDNGENPWFPGPILVHRRQRTKEFSYLWQAVKRFNKSASGIKILGTDDCDELHAGLMAELNDGVVHLLGVEHDKENISRKLNDYGIPLLQRQVIMDDIFGVSGLINSQSDSAYDEAVDLMKVKWSKIEGKFTRNVSPNISRSISKL